MRYKIQINELEAPEMDEALMIIVKSIVDGKFTDIGSIKEIKKPKEKK